MNFPIARPKKSNPTDFLIVSPDKHRVPIKQVEILRPLFQVGDGMRSQIHLFSLQCSSSLIETMTQERKWKQRLGNKSSQWSRNPRLRCDFMVPIRRHSWSLHLHMEASSPKTRCSFLLLSARLRQNPLNFLPARKKKERQNSYGEPNKSRAK